MKILLLHGDCRTWPGTRRSDLMQAYLTFGMLTREIGTKIKGLIQKGSFGAEFRCNGFAPGVIASHLSPRPMQQRVGSIAKRICQLEVKQRGNRAKVSVVRPPR